MKVSPEQSRTIPAGVEQKLASDRVRFTADYFDSRFRNIISFINRPLVHHFSLGVRRVRPYFP
jgi:hypothetical protein